MPWVRIDGIETEVSDQEYNSIKNSPGVELVSESSTSPKVISELFGVDVSIPKREVEQPVEQPSSNIFFTDGNRVAEVEPQNAQYFLKGSPGFKQSDEKGNVLANPQFENLTFEERDEREFQEELRTIQEQTDLENKDRKAFSFLDNVLLNSLKNAGDDLVSLGALFTSDETQANIAKNIDRRQARRAALIPSEFKQELFAKQARTTFEGKPVKVSFDSEGNITSVRDDDGQLVEVTQEFVEDAKTLPRSQGGADAGSLLLTGVGAMADMALLVLGTKGLGAGIRAGGRAAGKAVAKEASLRAGLTGALATQTYGRNFRENLKEFDGDVAKARNVALGQTATTALITQVFGAGIETAGALRGITSSTVNNAVRKAGEKATLKGSRSIVGDILKSSTVEIAEENVDQITDNYISILAGAEKPAYTTQDFLTTSVVSAIASAPFSAITAFGGKNDDVIIRGLHSAATNPDSKATLYDILDNSDQDEQLVAAKKEIVEEVQANIESENLTDEKALDFTRLLIDKKALEQDINNPSIDETIKAKREKQLERVTKSITELIGGDSVEGTGTDDADPATTPVPDTEGSVPATSEVPTAQSIDEAGRAKVGEEVAQALSEVDQDPIEGDTASTEDDLEEGGTESQVEGETPVETPSEPVERSEEELEQLRRADEGAVSKVRDSFISKPDRKSSLQAGNEYIRNLFPITAVDVATEYLAKGGKVSKESIKSDADVKDSSRVLRNFGSDNAKSIEGIADDLSDSLVGSDLDPQDIRNALIDLIKSHESATELKRSLGENILVSEQTVDDSFIENEASIVQDNADPSVFEEYQNVVESYIGDKGVLAIDKLSEDLVEGKFSPEIKTLIANDIIQGNLTTTSTPFNQQSTKTENNAVQEEVQEEEESPQKEEAVADDVSFVRGSNDSTFKKSSFESKRDEKSGVDYVRSSLSELEGEGDGLKGVPPGERMRFNQGPNYGRVNVLLPAELKQLYGAQNDLRNAKDPRMSFEGMDRVREKYGVGKNFNSELREIARNEREADSDVIIDLRQSSIDEINAIDDTIALEDIDIDNIPEADLLEALKGITNLEQLLSNEITDIECT